MATLSVDQHFIKKILGLTQYRHEKADVDQSQIIYRPAMSLTVELTSPAHLNRYRFLIRRLGVRFGLGHSSSLRIIQRYHCYHLPEHDSSKFYPIFRNGVFLFRQIVTWLQYYAWLIPFVSIRSLIDFIMDVRFLLRHIDRRRTTFSDAILHTPPMNHILIHGLRTRLCITEFSIR